MPRQLSRGAAAALGADAALVAHTAVRENIDQRRSLADSNPTRSRISWHTPLTSRHAALAARIRRTHLACGRVCSGIGCCLLIGVLTRAGAAELSFGSLCLCLRGTLFTREHMKQSVAA